MAVKQSKMMLADGFPAMPDFSNMEEGDAKMSDVYAAEGLIAHVQKTLKADQAYTIGDKFIYKGVIYAATGSIAKNANIVLSGAGANVEAVVDIQSQIDNFSGGTFDYSTTEVDTGQKWIDGKSIFCKVFTDLTATLSAGSLIATGADLTGVDAIISGVGYDNDGSIITLSYYNVSAELKIIGYQTGNVIKKITLFYTKTA